jgi:hypothetical protein
VSSGLRHLSAIVFGVVSDDNEMKHRETSQLIWERPNLIRFGAELAEEAFQQVRRTHQSMKTDVELIEGEALLDGNATGKRGGDLTKLNASVGWGHDYNQPSTDASRVGSMPQLGV